MENFEEKCVPSIYLRMIIAYDAHFRYCEFNPQKACHVMLRIVDLFA